MNTVTSSNSQNTYHILHTEITHPPRLYHHIWQNCCCLPPTKGQPIQSMPHCRRRLPRLPTWWKHIHCRYHNSQTTPQLHYFQPQCKIHHPQHWKLLPWYTLGPIWMHSPPHFHHSQWHSHKIQPQWHGLKQARKLAHKLLTQCLNPHGYYPCQFTPGIWGHKWRPTTFSLVVDDFGIKYIGIDHVHHPINTLMQWYKISINWSGSLFCDMSIKWDYHICTHNISMPGNINESLKKYQY